VGEERLEVLGDIRKGFGEDVDYLGIDRLDDSTQLAPGRADVFQLIGEEAVSLFEGGQLLDGERVTGPRRRSSRSSSRARAAGGAPGGRSGQEAAIASDGSASSHDGDLDGVSRRTLASARSSSSADSPRAARLGRVPPSLFRSARPVNRSVSAPAAS